MNKAPLDKETLKEIRGRLLTQEKEQSRTRNSKSSRQELYRNHDLGSELSTRAKEEPSESIEEDEEMSM